MWYGPKGSMPRCRYNVPFISRQISVLYSSYSLIRHLHLDLFRFASLPRNIQQEIIRSIAKGTITEYHEPRTHLPSDLSIVCSSLSVVTLCSLFFLYIMAKETDTTYVIQSPEKFSEKQVRGLVRTGLQARQQQEKTRSSFSVEKPSAQQYKNIASDSHRAYFLIKTPQHSSTSSSPSSQILLHSESASPRSVDDREGGFLMKDRDNRLSNQDIE